VVPALARFSGAGRLLLTRARLGIGVAERSHNVVTHSRREKGRNSTDHWLFGKTGHIAEAGSGGKKAAENKYGSK
jgi:hypothetical protein